MRTSSSFCRGLAGDDIDMKRLLLATLLFSSTAFAQFDGYSAVRISWDHVPEIDRNNPITYIVYVRLNSGDAWEQAQSGTNTVELSLADLGVNSTTKQLCFAIQSSRNGTKSELSDFGCAGQSPLSPPGSAVIELIP